MESHEKQKLLWILALVYLNLAAITQKNCITYFRTSNPEISVNYIRSRNFDTSRFLPDSHPSWRSPQNHLISQQSFLRCFSRNTQWLWQFFPEKNRKTHQLIIQKSSGCRDLIRLFFTMHAQTHLRMTFIHWGTKISCNLGRVVFSSFCLHTPEPPRLGFLDLWWTST